MNEQEYLIETMTLELAKLALAEGAATDVQSALDVVYNSQTYDWLCNPRTGLLYQHPGYVYSYLYTELHADLAHRGEAASLSLTTK